MYTMSLCCNSALVYTFSYTVPTDQSWLGCPTVLCLERLDSLRHAAAVAGRDHHGVARLDVAAQAQKQKGFKLKALLYIIVGKSNFGKPGAFSQAKGYLAPPPPHLEESLGERPSQSLGVGGRRLIFETDVLKAFSSCFTFKG